jgi:autotransporter-associated beta strand protein
MKHHLIIVAAVLVIANSCPAAPVYWFGTVGGSTEGGPGTWDTANNHFSTSQSGPADTPWNNTSNPGDPVFEGTAGTVIVSSITNNGTLTDNSGYTFQNSTLTLGPSSAVNVTGANNLTVGGSLVLAGGPLTKNGSGTLLLASSNGHTYTNNTVLNGGTLALGSGTGANLGANGAGNHLVINADGVTLAQRSTTGRSPQAAVDQLHDLIFDNGVSGASANIQFTLAQGYWKVNGSRKITALANTGGGVLVIGTTTGGATTDRIVDYNGNGTASWTFDSPGTVSISCDNDIAGGVTISAGTVRVPDNILYPFGSGTLTLGGGSLATTFNRGTTPITNSISITQNGTITTSSGTANTNINFILSGIISCTSGKVLTFTGNTPANQAFSPGLSGGFSYVGQVAVVNNGGATTLQLLNTTGNDQTFADVITGTGGINRSASTAGTGGNTIMNAANTYSGGTT